MIVVGVVLVVKLLADLRTENGGNDTADGALFKIFKNEEGEDEDDDFAL